MSDLDVFRSNLCSVLKYTEELISYNQKIIFDIEKDGIVVFYEDKVRSFDGVRIEPETDVWLKIARLRETQPPAPPEQLIEWVKDHHPANPDRKPLLLETKMVRLPLGEVCELEEANLIDQEDIMVPTEESQAADFRDVFLRIAKMPELKAEWDNYISNVWEKWAETERPRRRSIDFYNKIFQIYQRISAAGEDNTLELVWGIGLARWQHDTQRVNIPILEQPIEIELLEDGTLSIFPRSLPPTINLKPFHALEVISAKRLQREASEKLASIIDDPDINFSPFEKRSFEPILRACSAQLSPSAVYLPDLDDRDETDRSILPASDILHLSDTWVLYLRQKDDHFRRQDVQKLIGAIERATEEQLPPPGLKLITPPSNEANASDDGFDLNDISWSTSANNGWSDRETRSTASVNERPERRLDNAYFFPLPYNDEQCEILKRLQDADGALVQGPPGTGKTHTIANVICHYLAQGKRVLVTAKTSEALSALQEKIPDGVRDLAISIIHNDREGARQLEKAVEILANDAKQIREKEVSAEIIDKQRQIIDLLQRIEKIDNDILLLASKNFEQCEFFGATQTPITLAKVVRDQQSDHDWFTDKLSYPAHRTPAFDETDIKKARAIRAVLREDIIYSVGDYPDITNISDIAKVLAAHDELIREAKAQNKLRSGELPFLADIDQTALRELAEHLDSVNEMFAEINDADWLRDVYKRLIGIEKMGEQELRALTDALTKWGALGDTGRSLSLLAIQIPASVPLADPGFNSAISKLSRGERPFGLTSFLQTQAKAQIDAVSIQGVKPTEKAQWQKVLEYRIWQEDVSRFIDIWNSLAPLIRLPRLNTFQDNGALEVVQLGKKISLINKIAAKYGQISNLLLKAFPHGVDPRQVLGNGETLNAQEAIIENLERNSLGEAKRLLQAIDEVATEKNLPFHEALRSIRSIIGDPSVPSGELLHAWEEMLQEAKRLETLRGHRVQLDEIAEKISKSGARSWATKILSIPQLNDDLDNILPNRWRDAWDWHCAKTYLEEIANRERIILLGNERRELETKQRALLAEVVRLRTFLGLKKRLTNVVEVALAKFGAAVARLGAGTGKSATRQRRIIRDATFEAASAVPCWILPEWRVSEQLPAELAAFDLVIIDEASQSDITSLPAILRGKKLLIVGDDKQVSPVHIGLDDRKIIQLRTTYLDGLPFADQMDPATSLYELGKMMFPGKAILLREHFRCVEPIIRFSSRFYENLLVPMRLPKSSERLDPPLVDVYIAHGQKKGDVNHEEADFIVNEIKILVEDQAYSSRSIGVISLIGDKQANLIYNRIMRELGSEVVDRHRIMCGNAATFQGQERDIVFLSMVACPASTISFKSRTYEQRFNVAMSRARDRAYLVRSVSSSDLKPGDLKLAIIEHFRDPYKTGAVAQNKSILDLCESEFEKQFATQMIERGYRIRAQVPVAGFRLDFVIEGDNDSRLAIELDGDKWHGPEKWAADFARQTALEKLGWQFWRCWGSSWMLDPDGCLEDLTDKLTTLGIRPIGADTKEYSSTEFRQLTSSSLIETDTQQEAVESQIEGKNPSNVKAEIGRLVIIRFEADQNRVQRIRIVAGESRPNLGVYSASDIYVQDIMNKQVDDEVSVPFQDGSLVAHIEHIE